MSGAQTQAQIREADIRAVRDEIVALERALLDKAATPRPEAASEAASELDIDLAQRKRYLDELKSDLQALLKAPIPADPPGWESAPLKPKAVPNGLAIVVGHSPQGDTGAQGLTPPFPAMSEAGRSEYYWNKGLAETIQERAKARNIRCEIFHRTKNGAAGVRDAYRQVEAWSPKLCVELHFNAATGTARGTETLYGRAESVAWAKALQARMVAVYGREGRQNRGLKNAQDHGRGVASVTNDVQPCALIEPFFGDNAADAALAMARKADLGEAIVLAYLDAVGLSDPLAAPPPVAAPAPVPRPDPVPQPPPQQRPGDMVPPPPFVLDPTPPPMAGPAPVTPVAPVAPPAPSPVTPPVAAVPAPPVQAPPVQTPEAVGSLWDRLRAAYSAMPIEHPQLKAITFAQWALESGYGKSKLAQEHYNFAGMKWRDFMTPHSEKAYYKAHDGWEYYCKFRTLEKFVEGFWFRLDKHPAYKGWRDHVATGEDFMRFIGDIWAPSYENENYLGKVLKIHKELAAKGQLPTAGPPLVVASAARPESVAVGAEAAELSDEDLWIDRLEEEVVDRASSQERPSDSAAPESASMESARASARAARVSAVKWASDADAFDYAHLDAKEAIGTAFELTAADLDMLARLNSFPVAEAGDRPVLFGLRGATIVSGSSASDGTLRTAVTLKDIRPNHQEARCVMGVWDRKSGRLAVYPASTVPHAEAVVNWYETKEAGNTMPTGLYRYIVGAHNGRPGCFLLRRTIGDKRAVVVRRSSNDLCYQTTDLFMTAKPGNNIHPTFSMEPGWFSSYGCQVVVGQANTSGYHQGPWARFRKSAGMDDAYGSEGTPYLYMLLTGREALMASMLRRAGDTSIPATMPLKRIRFGSKGPAVVALKAKLGLAGSGDDYDAAVAESVYARQRQMSNGRCDGIVSPALDTALGGGILTPAEPIVAALPPTPPPPPVAAPTPPASAVAPITPDVPVVGFESTRKG